MSDGPRETWREGVDRELAHVTEKIDLRLAAIGKALGLQADEYERRLKELNHEAERLKEAAALAVSREKYDADRKGDQAALDVLRKTILEDRDEIMEHIHTQTGAAAWKAKVWSLVASGVAILVSIAAAVLGVLF